MPCSYLTLYLLRRIDCSMRLETRLCKLNINGRRSRLATVQIITVQWLFVHKYPTLPSICMNGISAEWTHFHKLQNGTKVIRKRILWTGLRVGCLNNYVVITNNHKESWHLQDTGQEMTHRYEDVVLISHTFVSCTVMEYNISLIKMS